MQKVEGIHHVTAIASNGKENIEFYRDVLGLRLVKKTINFDDPSSYHTYFGNESGAPGTLLTFFYWNIEQGRNGAGQASAVTFSIPKTASDYWKKRLDGNDIAFTEGERLGEKILSFNDPEGMPIELVECDDAREPWKKGSIPAKNAIRGVRGVTLEEEQLDATQSMLEFLGFTKEGAEGTRTRFSAGASRVDVVCAPDAMPAFQGAGTIHHIAYRTKNAREQEAWRERLESVGVNVTPIIERKYFTSIYFREEGGVLFEIATDGPGMDVDEPLEKLGEKLSLPDWLEDNRDAIEEGLPPLE